MRHPSIGLALALVLLIPGAAPVAAVQPSAVPVEGPSPAPSSDPAASAPVKPEPASPSPSAAAAASSSALPSTPPGATPAADPSAPADPPSSEAPTAPAASADPEPSPSVSPAPDVAAREAADAHGRPDVIGRYIVVLSGKTDARRFVATAAKRQGVAATKTFDRAFHGFTATLSPAQRRALLADPTVLEVVPDAVIELASQTTPNGVRRIGGRSSSVAAINGVDQRVNADVAIVDTGITRHPDLNVAGGYNCASSDRTAWRDNNHHGTHVAGTVAALDNDFGVVGVAPGARLWAVRILNDDGYGLLSWYVCGLDWILAQRDPADASRPLIEAVNMSVTKSGSDDHACGSLNADILHAAICRVVAGGITVVAAAANDSANAARRVPASYDEVITVSALADTDGRAGGSGGNSCFSWGTYDKDDTFADFSNYGADVDIMAPGKCIYSTVPGGYGYSSGTSMAAPAVTGAVALYKASRPNATPLEVKEALQYLGNLGWNTATDPDTRHEKLLDVSRLGRLGSFSFEAPASIPAFGEAGGAATVPVTIHRSATFFERVSLTLGPVPLGWTVSLGSSSLLGWTADATTLDMSLPNGVAQGTYPITVSATNQGRTRTLTILVVVENDPPAASAPTVTPITGSTVGVSRTVPHSIAMVLRWAAATDPTSAIAGYELEHQVDGGAWTDTRTLAADARTAIMTGLELGADHGFRLRARDAVGNWSAWAVVAPSRTFRAVTDRSISVTYRGTWRKSLVSSATNGVRTTSSQAGATASYTFTGRGIALVMTRSSDRGKIVVSIDNVDIATVDTHSSSAQPRRVVFRRTWTGAAVHTIKIRVVGTPGRPMASLDGFIVLR